MALDSLSRLHLPREANYHSVEVTFLLDILSSWNLHRLTLPKSDMKIAILTYSNLSFGGIPHSAFHRHNAKSVGPSRKHPCSHSTICVFQLPLPTLHVKSQANSHHGRYRVGSADVLIYHQALSPMTELLPTSYIRTIIPS